MKFKHQLLLGAAFLAASGVLYPIFLSFIKPEEGKSVYSAAVGPTIPTAVLACMLFWVMINPRPPRNS